MFTLPAGCLETVGRFCVGFAPWVFFFGAQGEGAVFVGDTQHGLFHVFSWQRKGARERQNQSTRVSLKLLRMLMLCINTPHVPLAKEGHMAKHNLTGWERTLQLQGSTAGKAVSGCEQITACTQPSGSTRLEVKYFCFEPSSPNDMLSVLRQVLQAMSQFHHL